jgi:hypothetical protein
VAINTNVGVKSTHIAAASSITLSIISGSSTRLTCKTNITNSLYDIIECTPLTRFDLMESKYKCCL